MPNLSEEQKYDISVALVTLIVSGFRDDDGDRHRPVSGSKFEQMLVRAFACVFACNNTTIVDDVQEAHALCESVTTALGAAFGDSMTERTREKLNRHLHERFAAYYEATDYIGLPSQLSVPLNLGCFEGVVPFEAFVVFEKAFCNFACLAEDDLDTDALVRATLSKDPMTGTFAYFLSTWDEAEKLIRATACPDRAEQS
jgi:hypothetical protein